MLVDISVQFSLPGRVKGNNKADLIVTCASIDGVLNWSNFQIFGGSGGTSQIALQDSGV
jgi:hypothetical protein